MPRSYAWLGLLGALSACDVSGAFVASDGNTVIAIGVDDEFVSTSNADQLASIATVAPAPVVAVRDRALSLDNGRLASISRDSAASPITTPTGSNIAHLLDNQANTLVGVNVEAIGGQGNNLDDTAFGIWMSDVVFAGDTVSADRAGAFLFGRRTREQEMPTIGGATYQGVLTAADRARDGSTILLDGPGQLRVDFGRRRLEGGFRLDQADGAWGQVDIASTAIDGADFVGNTVLSSEGHQGSIMGSFTGPRADEVGGVIDLQHSDGRQLVGAFGARFR